MTLDHLKHMNKTQRAAVVHGYKSDPAKPGRPLLIIAGAGTGKTETLSNRVVHFLASGVRPDNILLLTFTRKAAQEMTRRAIATAGRVLGTNVGEIPYSGTFHAVGARLVREFAEQLGLSPNFTIKDRGDSADLLDMVRHKLGFSTLDVNFPDKNQCLEIYSYKINACVPLKEVLKTKYPTSKKWTSQLRQLFAEYRAAKRKQNVFDYDDLLDYWVKMLKKPDIAAPLRTRFSHVLVDEYQDTNRLQAKILFGLKPDGRGVTVVGDDAQAIYSFRAATVENILDFPQVLPKVRVINLEQNYRSTNQILKACNAVINLSTRAYAKNLWSDRPNLGKPRLAVVENDSAQATYIANQVLRAKEEGIPFRAQAVLMRSSHHSQQLEIELTKRNIPFEKWGGVKFLEAAHIKDVLSLLRWLENPRDEVAAMRALKLLPGIGPSAAMKVIERLEGRVGRLVLRDADRPRGCGDHWGQFVRLIGRLQKRPWKASLPEVVEWYLPLMKHDNPELRAADLGQLCIVANTYSSREQFLVEVTLEPPEGTVGPNKPGRSDDDCLVLSTIHSAKGQEWDHVYLLNAVDGCIPSSKAKTPAEIEEERRLLYVAMTRAKNRLSLMVPQRVFSWRQNSSVVDLFTRRSQFIPRSAEKLFVVRAASRKPQTRRAS
ncbi:ATP-dependent helicase [Bradyrhizobium sp. CCBAU 53415]|uniref:ATP-dependent helicase n=1 Tax=Bradyrhizobium sp. CCBAU 53415 TaxID=1325119 RepID=UPI002305555A|nr:ATP-dependent helicase [Bradyrhizobium sp. CCBAU 53415]MDA9467520.1 ATP-dependent DNA helicase [Bradyrhizobium sp. CCBAU 53415]